MEQLQPQTGASPYQAAFASLRAAKNWFAWLMLLAVVINLACFIAVRYAGALEGSVSLRADLTELRPPPAPRPLPTTGLVPGHESGAIGAHILVQVPAPTTLPAGTMLVRAVTQPATKPATQPAISHSAEWFYQMLGQWLPTARSLGLICAMLLFLVLLISVKVTLVGRLEGIARLMSAMLWSLLLVVFFVPWRTTFPDIILPSVLFDRTELITDTASVAWGAADVTWADSLLYYARFIGYPLLVVLVWLNVQVKYALARRTPSAPAKGEIDAA